MDALSEEDAGGTVELRYDDALGTVDDESAPFSHVRDGTQIHVLNRGVEILMLRICAVELQLCLQRHAVCQPSVETFVDRVAGRVDEVVYEFEYEIVSGIGNTLNSPSLRRFSGVVSSWKKSLKDFSCTSKKSGYSRRVLEDANEIR